MTTETTTPTVEELQEEVNTLGRHTAILAKNLELVEENNRELQSKLAIVLLERDALMQQFGANQMQVLDGGAEDGTTSVAEAEVVEV